VSVFFCILAFLLGFALGYWIVSPARDLNQEQERHPFSIIPPRPMPEPCEHCRISLKEFLAYRKH
jgi:hypothetical protein